MKRAKRLGFTAVLQSCLALLLPFHLLGQQPTQPSVPNSPVIKTDVNEVLVPVVVRDARGGAVGSLEKDNFQVFDNGKQQAITGFSVLKRSTDAAVANASPPTPNAAPVSPRPASPAQRFVVFLFDDLDLSTRDLSQAQQAATKLLETSLPASDVAAVLSTSGANSGLTRDRAKLQQAIEAVRVRAIYQHGSSECPDVDYYQGDLIVNKNDGMALQAAAQDTLSCANLPNDAAGMQIATRLAQQAAQRAVAIGDQNSRTNLDFLKVVVSKMGPLPGQHVIILISPGFLTPTADAMILKSQILDVAAKANVVINTIDARGLYTTMMEPSQRGGGSPLATRLENQYLQDSMVSSEDVLSELADGTGGTFFHHNNDIETGLSTLFSGPEYVYLLTFSTADLKSNGAYHRLKVKVNQAGLNLQARRGYVAPAPEKNKK